jgi:uncharacterized membrane protein YsdA (DUF1294 family)
MLLVSVAGLVLLVNFVAFISFRHDKKQARLGGWRISESTLLGLALVGGSPAALLARRVYRHKTRKEPFSTRLLLIAMLQVGALVGWQLGG